MPPDAIWGIAVTALTGVIAFLYKLLVRSQAREDAALLSERTSTARMDSVLAVLKVLADGLGSGSDRPAPRRSRRRAGTEG